MLQCKQRLGDFEIVRLLGRGGMGEVYEAQQFHPPRRVALKVLAPWLAGSPDALERFWREAAVPAQLDHPNIVRIIATGQTPGGIAYYAMQLVRGVTLADVIRLATAGPLPSTLPQPTVPEAVPPPDTPVEGALVTPPAEPLLVDLDPAVLRDYVRDRFHFVARHGAVAARGLAYAHRQGFLHRDVKPSNLMIDRHDHLYLLDFGLTRPLQPEGEGTLPGLVRGTPWYMSPEQARGEAVDARSDIYSLGVTLYELATGGVGPLTASRQNPDAVVAEVKAGQRLPLRLLAPAIPAELERIILKAMDFQPERRYRDAAELATDLERVARSEPPNQQSRRAPSVSGGWRHPALTLGALLLGCVVLGLAAAGAVVAWRGRGPGAEVPRPNVPAPAPGEADGGLPGAGVPGERAWNVPRALFRLDQLPVSAERLAGEGECLPDGAHLVLCSPPRKRATLIALDNDPERRWFEFAIELCQVPGTRLADNELGIFFGYRRSRQDPASPPRFFVVQVDQSPAPGFPHGQVRIGSTRRLEPRGVQAEIDEGLRPIPGDRGVLALPQPGDGHHLCLRVLEDRITLTLDRRPAHRLELDLAELRRVDPEAGSGLDPRGALGIWVRDGRGCFRQAWVTPLPPAADAR
jgi:serine/threonine protein kinase